VVQSGTAKVDVIVGFEATRKSHSSVNHSEVFDELDEAGL
jgi:hypothetical protein